MKVVTVFGGAGFLGRYVVQELARAGWVIRVVTRKPESAKYLKTSGAVGQVVIEQWKKSDKPEDFITRGGAAVNLIGALFERNGGDFKKLHTDIPAMIAASAARLGVKKLVHVSALGVDKAEGSKYAKTKLEGEKAVTAAFPDAVILRPSVIFGPGDGFFGLFASMSGFSPVLPLVGGGVTKFQPVYAGDVARVIRNAVTEDPAPGVYELGGPEVITMKRAVELTLQYAGRERKLVNIPFPLASVIAVFTGILPKPLLTCDQVKLLRTDNVVSPGAKGFESLGITPTPISAIVPESLARFRKLKFKTAK